MVLTVTNSRPRDVPAGAARSGRGGDTPGVVGLADAGQVVHVVVREIGQHAGDALVGIVGRRAVVAVDVVSIVTHVAGAGAIDATEVGQHPDADAATMIVTTRRFTEGARDVDVLGRADAGGGELVIVGVAQDVGRRRAGHGRQAGEGDADHRIQEEQVRRLHDSPFCPLGDMERLKLNEIIIG